MIAALNRQDNHIPTGSRTRLTLLAGAASRDPAIDVSMRNTGATYADGVLTCNPPLTHRDLKAAARGEIISACER